MNMAQRRIKPHRGCRLICDLFHVRNDQIRKKKFDLSRMLDKSRFRVLRLGAIGGYKDITPVLEKWKRRWKIKWKLGLDKLLRRNLIMMKHQYSAGP